MRDDSQSFQMSPVELPALEALLSAVERGTAHLGVVAATGEAMALSPTLESGLLQFLRLLRAGRAVEVLAADEELSPNEVADRLLVSRTFVNKLLERGELPYRMVGSHKRIPLAAVLAYREIDMARRRDGMALIADISQMQAGEIDDPYPGRGV